jgi:hypothetical protein
MRRREFITLLGGAAAAWPLPAHAQQSGRPRLVGLISGFSDAEFAPLAAAFRLKLRQLGWTDGRDIDIETRTSSGDFKQLGEEASRSSTAHPRRSSRVRVGCRPGPAGLHREPVPSRRARHRLHQF